jgi:superfamily II RNA helicase
MINRLIDIIGREAALFESFLALFEKQQDMLVINDADGLNEVTKCLHEKAVESRLMNKEREEVIEQVRLENSIEGDLNVTRLLDIVDDEQASQLIRLRELITTLNDKIATTRNQNAALLNQSREYINNMMGMLSKLSHPEPSYSSTGAGKQASYNLALDRRA